MELVSDFRLNPYRIYKSSKRAHKGIATFLAKSSPSYLDYSIDFSRKLQTDERIISGKVTVNGAGLIIQAVVCNGSYLTAFVDGGIKDKTYYLTFHANTNCGGFFTQDMILSVIGKSNEVAKEYSFLTHTENVSIPNIRPPLNGLKINDRYLLNDNGFFMVI